MAPLSLLCLIFGGTLVSSVSKIALYPSNVTDTYGLNAFGYPAQWLLDEQLIAGDPLNNPSSSKPCKNPWLPTYKADWYQSGNPSFPTPRAVIDLGAMYDITNICTYTTNPNWDVIWQVFKTNPFQNPIQSLKTNINYNWNGWACRVNFTSGSAQGQFISITLLSPPETSLLELVIYGNKIGESLIPKQRSSIQSITSLNRAQLSMLIGTNVFGWTPISNLTNSVGTVREYQDWSWTEGFGMSSGYPGYPNNQNRFECTYVTPPNTFCLDDDYKNATINNNLQWHQVLFNTPSWLHNYNNSQQNWKPISDKIFFINGSTENPKSYIEYADHMWQATARYGTNTVNDNLLKLAPNKSMTDATPQPRISGTNMLKWIELWNEPNCWWEPREVFFSGTEQIALTSAAYDAHCGTMGDTVGIKNLDPMMKVSFGALANMTVIDRWQTLYWWSMANRQDSKCVSVFPAEAINMHFYAQNSAGNAGISPEDYNVYENMIKLREWRDKVIPNVELWITEYGYDTNEYSPQHSPSIGSMSGIQVQGAWLMRTVFAMNAAGIDRAHQFMWADSSSYSGGIYSTSGLVMDKTNGYKPKDSYYFWTSMYRLLKNTYFVNRDCTKNNGNICQQGWSMNIGSNKPQIWAIWCSTSIDQKINGYSLNIGNNNNNASLITPTVGNPNGVKTPLMVNDGVVTINVSELPVFVSIVS